MLLLHDLDDTIVPRDSGGSRRYAPRG